LGRALLEAGRRDEALAVLARGERVAEGTRDLQTGREIAGLLRRAPPGAAAKEPAGGPAPPAGRGGGGARPPRRAAARPPARARGAAPARERPHRARDRPLRARARGRPLPRAGLERALGRVAPRRRPRPRDRGRAAPRRARARRPALPHQPLDPLPGPRHDPRGRGREGAGDAPPAGEGEPQMSEPKSFHLSAPAHEYLVRRGTPPDAVLRELAEETARLGPISMMQIAPEQGAFMTLLARAICARRAVEVGTFTGYSALCIARGLPDDGQLLACDV